MPWFQRLQTNEFLRHHLIFFIGSLIAAALNYLFYPILGRLMDVVHFGETQVLVSLFMQTTILFTVTTIVITHIVANDQVLKVKKSNDKVVAEFEKLMIWLSLGIMIVFLLTGDFIRTFFHFESVWPIYAITLALLFTFPLTISQAYLKGKKLFGAVNLSNIVSALFKVVIPVVLVLGGMKTFGAILGIALSQLVALIYTQWQARAAGYQKSFASLLEFPQFDIISPQLKYAGFVFVISLIVTLQFSVDIFFVKRFFDPQTAGLYAGIATIARIIYFLTASVAAVLLSNIKVSNAVQHNRKLLLQSGVFLTLLGGTAVLVFSLLPQLIVSILMGSQYQALVHLLPGLSLAIFIISITNLLLTYCMGLRLYNVIFPSIGGSLLTFVLLAIRHGDGNQIVQSLLIGSTALLGLVIVWAVVEDRRSLLPEEAL